MSRPAGALLRARRSLRSARILLEADDPTAALSRAYYAMFYVARAALWAEGVAPRTHAGLIGAFGRTFVQAGRLEATWGRVLREVFEARQFADYAEEEAFDLAEVEHYVERAAQFVERLAGVLGT